jgi:hypothetical protein
MMRLALRRLTTVTACNLQEESRVMHHLYGRHYGQGHYYCQVCGHAVNAQYGGCRTCQTPLTQLMLLDDAFGNGYAQPGIGFDPYDGNFAFNMGNGLAIEPDGQLDVEVAPGLDVPVQDDPFFGGW